MIILQISPEFSPGTGVGGVAYALEKEWLSKGHDVRRFGVEEAGCAWLDGSAGGLRGRVQHAARVVWFSSVGTFRARRAVRRLPLEAVSICHNDALAGDVYVNHGVLTSAMKARGGYAWRMVRNPLHLFTASRDVYRYRSATHQAVVSLSEADRLTLLRDYRLDPSRAVVIPNGVPVEHFTPATDEQRTSTRQALGIPRDGRVAAFIGHEFDRKGLPVLLAAVADLPDHHVIVVGGTPAQIEAQRTVLTSGVSARVHWLGRVPDPREALAAADVLVLPSAYEANPLVVLEALACGLQVVVTPVGSIPEMLANDSVSRVVERTVEGVRSGLSALARLDLRRPEVQDLARARALAAHVGCRRGVIPGPVRPRGRGARKAEVKVTHVIRSDGFAGVERHVATLAKAQAAAGHEVQVVGGDPARMAPVLASAGVRSLPGDTLPEAAGQVRRHARHADIVHAHMTAGELTAVLSTRAPIVATRHFARRRGAAAPGRMAGRLIRRRVRAQIAISHYVASAVDGPSAVVYPGIEVVDRDAVTRRPVVLVVQRLQPEKSTDVALRAFAEGAPEGWTLEVLGRGPEMLMLQSLADELGISARVSFLGFRDDVSDALLTSAVLLAPCAVEGFGLSVLEAMAHGLPVVASRAGAHPETVGRAPHARLFDPGDWREAGALLSELIADPEARAMYGAELRGVQRSTFTPEAQADATEAVYRGVLR